jgi:hypothetical protein
MATREPFHAPRSDLRGVVERRITNIKPRSPSFFAPRGGKPACQCEASVVRA